MDNNNDLLFWKLGQMNAAKGYAAAAKGKGGVSWSFADLVSATVENDAPTNVVLTFPSANAALDETSFTIAGFTISSASWTDAVLTLVLSTPVLVFDGDLTLTYVLTSETTTITNNVADDTHTMAWYDSQDLTTITKDANDLVSRWNDKLGSGHNLIQTNIPADCPKWSLTGIYNQGADFLDGEVNFTWNQPMFVYMIVKQKGWTINKYFYDGGTNDRMLILTRVATPSVVAHAGTDSTISNDMALNKWVITRVLYNGANSKFQIDDNAAITGNFGANNAGGFTLFSRANLTNPANIEVYEIILRDSALLENEIYAYLEKKKSLL